MKKFFMMLAAVMLSFSSNYAQINKTAPEGSGTADDPFQITSLENLSWMTQASGISYNKYFIQLNDIDASATKYWDKSDDNSDGDLYNDPNDLTEDGANDGWNSVGGELIKVHYDGQGHIIDGLTINGGENACFFNTMVECRIENLGITNINYKHIGDYSAALVGQFKGDTIMNCYSSGKISGGGDVDGGGIRIGGLVGFITGSAANVLLENCHSSVDIDSCQNYIGGLIGNIKGVNSVNVVNSYAEGNVTHCAESIGGLVGKIENTTVDEETQLLIKRCYAEGDISASLYVGGLIGYLYDKMEMDNRVIVEDCYSRGSLEQLKIVHYDSDPSRIKDGALGGLIGWNKYANVKNAYAVGSVVYLDTVAAYDRGVLGKTTLLTKDSIWVGTVESCFFDSTVSNQTSDKNSTVRALTTQEMQTDSIFVNAGWDFENVWEIVGEDYPTFKKVSSAVEESSKDLAPIDYALNQNYPNPFNPTTVIGFTLPMKSHVELAVYNLLGQKIAELINADMSGGYHEVNFMAKDLSSGVYIYRISSGDFSAVKKMMLIK